jgi:hypothetical protein
METHLHGSESSTAWQLADAAPCTLSCRKGDKSRLAVNSADSDGSGNPTCLYWPLCWPRHGRFCLGSRQALSSNSDTEIWNLGHLEFPRMDVQTSCTEVLTWRARTLECGNSWTAS